MSARRSHSIVSPAAGSGCAAAGCAARGGPPAASPEHQPRHWHSLPSVAPGRDDQLWLCSSVAAMLAQRAPPGMLPAQLLFLTAGASLLVDSRAAGQSERHEVTVNTSDGAIRGLRHRHGVESFRAVYYAEV
eukprot:SAG31_NODE_2259_length_6068_cov_10.272240_3_plen_132_part_00